MNSFSFRSYFKFLSRNKGYTAINLVGFSVSLTFVILLGLYVQQELSVDRFHTDADRIYRLTEPGGNGFAWAIAKDLENRYPAIESTTRFNTQTRNMQKGELLVRATVLFVDSNFFTFFSFPLAEGAPEYQLRSPQEITLSRSFALKMFGNEDPIGQSMQMDTVRFTVTGIAEDLKNSHIANPDVYIHGDNLQDWITKQYSNAGAASTYLKIQPGADFSAQIPEILEWFKTFYWIYKDGYQTELGIEPLFEVYFNPDMSHDSSILSNSKQFIWILLAAALVILLFAVTNYINLSVAQSGFRAREAATRRLLGGSRGTLFRNFVFESILFCFGAFILALIFTQLLETPFNKLLGSQIDFTNALTPVNALLVFLCVVLLGIVSGLIPAVVISRYKPIEVVRGTFKRKTKMVYSKVFIAFQYTITIILLGCAVTIMKQTYFMRHTDMGFAKENIVYIQGIGIGGDKKAAFRDRLMQIGGVEQISFSRGTPVSAHMNMIANTTEGKPYNYQHFTVDTAFFHLLDIEVLSETGAALSNPRAIWINEEFARQHELTAESTDFEGDVLAGIVKNFNFASLTEQVGPAMIEQLRPNWGCYNALVKISGNDPGAIYRSITAEILDFNNNQPFESGFMDQRIDSWYDEQERTYSIIGSFSLIAILISALGLLAMATYFIRQEAMNVAVRKVFGSTNREILERLVASFLKIVAVSFVIAVPVIWYAMTQWLKGYAYHISLRWTIFALAGTIAFAIAFAAVFWQSYRATTANPIDSLKNQ